MQGRGPGLPAFQIDLFTWDTNFPTRNQKNLFELGNQPCVSFCSGDDGHSRTAPLGVRFRNVFREIIQVAKFLPDRQVATFCIGGLDSDVRPGRVPRNR